MAEIQDQGPLVIVVNLTVAYQEAAGPGVSIREYGAVEPGIILEFLADRPEHCTIVRDRMDDIDDFDDFPEVPGGKSDGWHLPFVGANYGGCDGAIPPK
jgi:hypothetical protein